MAYQHESLQNVLPSTITSGWNDPPTVTAATSSATANRLKQMRNRPVHPSITGPSYGAGVYGHSGAHQNPYGAPQGYPQGPNQGHQSQPSPQAYSGYGQPQPVNSQQQPYSQAQQYPGQFSPSAVSQPPQQQQFFAGGQPNSSPGQISPNAVQQQGFQQQPSYQQHDHFHPSSQVQSHPSAAQHYGQGNVYSGQPSHAPVGGHPGGPTHPSPTSSYPMSVPHQSNNMAYYPQADHSHPTSQVHL